MFQNSKKFKKDQEDKCGISRSSVRCVLDKEFTVDTPLVSVYIGTIPDQKLTRETILELNRVLPIPELQHLKRVKQNKILLCYSNDRTEEDVRSELIKSDFNLKLLSKTLDIASVLKYPPKTRDQFLRGNKLWPTNFHENKYLESLIGNSLFSDEELRQHEKWMRSAVEAGRRSEVDGKIGTAIVDPKRKLLMAVASDARSEHPIKHSVMVAIDLVARGQGGGAWSPHPADYFRPEADGIDSYLCTGYYVYTTHEPCTMCAMALVHSRVKRVFYALSMPDGSLGTIQNIHTVNNLNHHYEVFKGLLEDEVKKLHN